MILKSLKNATAFVAFFFIITSSIVAQPKTATPPYLTRFVYKYYYVLPRVQLLETIGSELLLIYPSIDTGMLATYMPATSDDLPRNLIDVIDMIIARSVFDEAGNYTDMGRFGSYLNVEDSPLDKWLEAVADCEVYLVFASETGSKVESSFGHVAVQYSHDGAFFFSSVVSFVATEFADPVTGTPTVTSYFKGAFGRIAGRYTSLPMFDYLYRNVVTDERRLIRYRIDLSKAEKLEFNRRIWYGAHEVADYNFFNNNCSSSLFNILADLKKLESDYGRVRPPSTQVKRFERIGMITYHDCIIAGEASDAFPIFASDLAYDSPLFASYTTISSYFSRDGFNLAIIPFHFNRPEQGIVDCKVDVQLLAMTVSRTGDEISFTEITPLHVMRNTPITKRFGAFFSYSLTLSESVRQELALGMYLSLGNFKLVAYPDTLFADAIPDSYNLEFFYSSKYIDMKNTISYDRQERVSFGSEVDVFITPATSLFINIENVNLELGLSVHL